MNTQLTSIPEMLVKTRGNMSEVARAFNIHRFTVKRYARDYQCRLHVVVNGVLMVAQGNRGVKQKDSPCK